MTGDIVDSSSAQSGRLHPVKDSQFTVTEAISTFVSNPKRSFDWTAARQIEESGLAVKPAAIGGAITPRWPFVCLGI
jgi:hypothetical protein